jgi:hypothetical protein
MLRVCFTALQAVEPRPRLVTGKQQQRNFGFSMVDVTNDQEASINFAPAIDPSASIELAATALKTSPSSASKSTGITMPLKPSKPLMGDLVQVSTTEWTAWTGGKSNPSWTNLDGSVMTYGSPNQLRPNSAAYVQRGFQYRSTGLKEKFKQ